MKRLLVVANCPSKNTQHLFDSVLSGARDEMFDIEVIDRYPLECGPEDVLKSDALILGSTENFGYMSGQIKDFLERIYYPCLTQTEGKPVAIYIKGGLDGQGAKQSIEKILLGLRWKHVQDTLVLKGPFHEEFTDACFNLGQTMAAGLDAGIY